MKANSNLFFRKFEQSNTNITGNKPHVMSIKVLPEPVVPIMPLVLTMNLSMVPFPSVLCLGENCDYMCMPYSNYCRKCGLECKKCGKFSYANCNLENSSSFAVFNLFAKIATFTL